MRVLHKSPHATLFRLALVWMPLKKNQMDDLKVWNFQAYSLMIN